MTVYWYSHYMFYSSFYVCVCVRALVGVLYFDSFYLIPLVFSVFIAHDEGNVNIPALMTNRR